MTQKKLGFGLMRLPLTDPKDEGSVNLELYEQMVDRFLAQGFTYFDTAWMYCGHKSEEATGKALVARHPRDSYTLTTKLPPYPLKTLEDRDRVFSEQLRRTGAGYFDYYLLHNVNAKSIQVFNKLDCFTWLQEKKAEGLVRTTGISFHGPAELLDQVLTAHPELEIVQLQINYLDWDSDSVQSRACYEVAVKHGKPVIVMEPVKGGSLARVPAPVEEMFLAHDPKASVPSWAIRFAASLDNVFMVLSGMSDMAQLEDNTAYMADFHPLTAEEVAMTTKAAEVINANIPIACTGCSYCTEQCPMDIPIPKYFSLYNADTQEIKEKSWTAQGIFYMSYSTTFGKASDCVECGRCETLCPQHLPIRKYLKDVAAHFE